MPTVFDQCFAAVIGAEGGYANNPADPGGETKFGISKRSYPSLDIKSLTLDDAKTIYRNDYWNRVQGDTLPPPLALVVFDSAVNNGVSRAVKWLQLVAGVPQDGIVGPATLAAAARKPMIAVMTEFMAERMLFQLTLPTVNAFGRGWARRLAALPFAAMALEQQGTRPPPAPAPSPIMLSPDVVDAIEREITKQLQERALTDALNQRAPTT